MNCDQVRRKITKLLFSGEMKVTEFQREINVNSNSYSRFMKQKGPIAGANNNTYYNAHIFFEKRRKEGLDKPAAKKQKTTENILDKQEVDITNVHLDGEETETVPIYDSCDIVRRKINAYLRTGTMTQAAFCRSLGSSLPGGRTIQGKQLKDFLIKSGPTSGAASIVYYAAYVFFEKRRIAQKKEKSKHRQEMEKQWGIKGVEKIDSSQHGCWVLPNERPVENQYGKISVVTIK